MHKRGFTLAEVLITLSIIGVVAALTVPAVTRQFQEVQYKNSFKKMYSELAQVTLMIKAENGGTLKGIFTNDDVFRNKYTDHMSYVRRCNESGATNCWHAANQWYYLNGTPYNHNFNYYSKFVSKSGAFIIFDFFNTDCTVSSGICGQVNVDVNGYKGPNTIGRDIFYTYVMDRGLVPVGTQGVIYADRCDSDPSASTEYGYGCASYVLRNIDY